MDKKKLIEEVADLYAWLDGELAKLGHACRACGDCCDFESFGHRLYVTTPEVLYFAHQCGGDVRQMPGGVCPYRVDGRCGAYAHRFSGCRIFNCTAAEEPQNELCEEVLRRFKALCTAHNLEYRYQPLSQALNG